MIEKIQIWGSLQAHRVIENIEGGVCPCIGTTDFGLPRVLEYEDDTDKCD